MNSVEKLVATVLYEGYILWPYRRSAKKNQRRWTFGGVYPRAYSEAVGGHDPWRMQTQCLVLGDAPSVRVAVRFLHVVERRVGRKNAAGSFDFVDDLQIGEVRYLAWEEATEREIAMPTLPLPALRHPQRVEIDIPAGSDEEPLQDANGEVAGTLVHSWQPLAGAVEVEAVALRAGRFQLTVRITNTTPWRGQDRDRTLKQTFVSTHTILTVENGTFVSLTDPPEDLQAAAESCQNLHTWPVLVGEKGERHTLLSSPIILYDYPQVAPESPGDLFDGTEIDQLLVLNILALTDEEKAEMRASDPRAREMLKRCEAFTTEDFMRLHGTIRDFQPLASEHVLPPLWEALEKPVPQRIVVNGVAIQKGSRVRLRPRSGADVMDIVLAGKVAIIEAIEQDYDDRLYLAVVLEADPGRDLGEMRQPGHRFFFSPAEVEPLDGNGR
jgi:hypothetical protein